MPRVKSGIAIVAQHRATSRNKSGITPKQQTTLSANQPMKKKKKR
jgi:hypothetical protein